MFGQAVHGHRGDVVLGGFRNTVNYIESYNYVNSLNKINTTSTALSIGFTYSKKPKAAMLFASLAIASEALLYTIDNDSVSTSKLARDLLLETFWPKGFKGDVSKEIFKNILKETE